MFTSTRGGWLTRYAANVHNNNSRKQRQQQQQQQRRHHAASLSSTTMSSFLHNSTNNNKNRSNDNDLLIPGSPSKSRGSSSSNNCWGFAIVGGSVDEDTNNYPRPPRPSRQQQQRHSVFQLLTSSSSSSSSWLLPICMMIVLLLSSFTTIMLMTSTESVLEDHDLSTTAAAAAAVVIGKDARLVTTTSASTTPATSTTTLISTTSATTTTTTRGIGDGVDINNNSNNVRDMYNRTTTTPTTTTGTTATPQQTIDIGILSHQNESFFRYYQNEIDRTDPTIRCPRYGYTYNHDSSDTSRRRRIFYGALIASESWELLEIVAAETYGIYSGIVLVESNRTQSGIPRPWLRYTPPPQDNERGNHDDDNNHTSNNDTTMTLILSQLFGLSSTTKQIQIRPFVNENHKIRMLQREQLQRAEIIHGWYELGMTVDDVGIIADIDETFTRDCLRAIQICDNIPQLDYDSHKCRHDVVKITALTRVYEGTPECITSNRKWFHPDMILGHCIDGIANMNDNRHPEEELSKGTRNATSTSRRDPLNDHHHRSAPREREGSFLRAPGYGRHCNDWELEDQQYNITGSGSLWSAGDFRRTCSGPQVKVIQQSPQQEQQQQEPQLQLDRHTGYHFHNFLAHIHDTKFKYGTYGHADRNATRKFIGNLSDDLYMMVQCVNNNISSHQQSNDTDGRWKYMNHVDALPFIPIYFQDSDYRQRRHAHVRDLVLADEQLFRRDNNHDSGGAEFSPTTTALLDDDNNAKSATVIALASGYDLRTYQRFVGSLRRTGYNGHIILGLHPNPSNRVLRYLQSRNVMIRPLTWVNCTYTRIANESSDNNNDIFQKTTCAHPYPDVKIRWSRFPLARDWLTECTTCTGPVLITDARDVVFQRNPFARDVGSSPVQGLQVFEEHPNMTTNNWLTEWPIRVCKNISLNDQPMLCSGTTIGTRSTMLLYLEIMYREMKVWIEDPKCRFDINGDDQSIHNYLYYTGQFPVDTVAVKYRHGGIVNTIGFPASQLAKQYIQPVVVRDSASTHNNASEQPRYPGANNETWIGTELGLTNTYGLFTELDGGISRVVHQWDRFGSPYTQWLRKQPWVQDKGSIPEMHFVQQPPPKSSIDT